jgi:GDP-mannose 6-dehydrogenase
MVELSERLIGKGFDVKIHDATVVLSRLVGSNRTFISEQLPHLGDLLTATVDEVLDHGEVLIVGSRSGEIVDALTRIDADKLVIDLVRLPNADQLRSQHNYRGIGW